MRMTAKQYTFIDLFAGAGGFGLGFQLSGRFVPICSVEKDLWAVETLKANNAHKIIHADITKISTKAKIEEICSESPDVIIGGPPCQGFSLAGKGDPSDPRNTLFRYFVKWVKVLQPKVFVMENVAGLLIRKNADGENVIDIIKEAFTKAGYTCEAWTLNAADYGVPQVRHRVVIAGTRVGEKIAKPKPVYSMDSETGLPPYVTAWEALSDLPQIAAREGGEFMNYDSEATNDYQRLCRVGSDGVHNHEAMLHTARLVSRFQSILDGGSIATLPEELRVRKRNGNGEYSESLYQSNYRHIEPNQASYTIPASFYSTFIHPFIPRNITAREAARIQSFPDRYVFKGKRTLISSKLMKKLGKDDQNHLSQYNQVGNAVPPLMAKAIAARIASYLDGIK